MRDRSSPLTAADIGSLAWEKMDGLLPAAVQDASTGQLLMLGYMSPDALAATFERGVAVFHSRSRDSLWEKGATSGNRLVVQKILSDCDGDALLVTVEPAGPACHFGTASCFGATGAEGVGFLAQLSRIVASRAGTDPSDSYTARLLSDGPAKVAQKVGEEGVE
ncbi:MAG: bifunctional phosphoribosyl-AMP cyclohydrolase/phosphoribosyl-ATP diphosphatase HisIE, partial [Allosphingosinicella sp.]